ncbi:MAG: protein TolR [Deltaproteobacteria bacterium]|nr:protein TolR [Deltaproteobacteria bacterium]
MTGGGGDEGRLMAEINVTPLVDVMLVLLIIFMVTAPMMIQGVAVALPQTSAAPMDSTDDNLVLSVNRAREIYINDYKADLPTLTAKLSAMHQGRPEQRVFLRADKDTPYGVVVQVMAAVKEAGIDKLGVVTEPAPASPASGGKVEKPAVNR